VKRRRALTTLALLTLAAPWLPPEGAPVVMMLWIAYGETRSKRS
jgi:hypothetical protein